MKLLFDEIEAVIKINQSDHNSIVLEDFDDEYFEAKITEDLLKIKPLYKKDNDEYANLDVDKFVSGTTKMIGSILSYTAKEIMNYSDKDKNARKRAKESMSDSIKGFTETVVDFKDQSDKAKGDKGKRKKDDSVIVNINIKKDSDLSISGNSIEMEITSPEISFDSLNLKSNALEIEANNIHILNDSVIKSNSLELEAETITLDSELKISSNSAELTFKRDDTKPIDLSYSGNQIDAEVVPKGKDTVGVMKIKCNGGSIESK